ncbi:hypothetical protein F7725_010788 [Dissostichus mawsoni]|uniref:Hydroxyacid-oxoacid transhydrogenase, mitochondrial n=1 Tax=Dissostichus mawsoni TaxID=36200 RepID=A0A7J5ZA57_DISMA|nr:hypothetical protein F7725_010788 [Dissostichus mawsoni]
MKVMKRRRSALSSDHRNCVSLSLSLCEEGDEEEEEVMKRRRRSRSRSLHRQEDRLRLRGREEPGARNVCVTDSNLSRLPPVKAVLESLSHNGVRFRVYDSVRVEPTDTSFKEAISFAKSDSFDVYVAVGGGSVIDTFPTTAGTGSETTGVAIFDYEPLKAKTGLQPHQRRVVRHALRVVAQFMKRAVRDPEDLEARSSMHLASVFAGIGFGTPEFICGYSVEHALVPHGLSVVLTAPAVFNFTAPMCPERHLEAAEILGADIRQVKMRDAGPLLADTLRSFLFDLQVEDGLSAVGYSKDDVPALVRGTVPQRRCPVETLSSRDLSCRDAVLQRRCPVETLSSGDAVLDAVLQRRCPVETLSSRDAAVLQRRCPPETLSCRDAVLQRRCPVMVVVSDHRAGLQRDLDLRRGDQVLVLFREENSCFGRRSDGQEGYFPPACAALQWEELQVIHLGSLVGGASGNTPGVSLVGGASGTHLGVSSGGASGNTPGVECTSRGRGRRFLQSHAPSAEEGLCAGGQDAPLGHGTPKQLKKILLKPEGGGAEGGGQSSPSLLHRVLARSRRMSCPHLPHLPLRPPDHGSINTAFQAD